MDILRINNATIVNDNTVHPPADILIRNGRIAAIGRISSRQHPAPTREIDATGRLLLPGLIDDQVHFREPGQSHKASIATESRAAIAGGVTSYMDMPNNIPPATTHALLEAKHTAAAQTSSANYAFYLGATHDNLAEIKRADPRTTCGIKVFMGSSTGNMLVDDPAVLEKIFAESPLLIATHCEHTPTIQANEARARQRYGDTVPASEHPRIRSAEACLKSTRLALEIARRHNTRLHILHITTAPETALLASPDTRPNKRITAEACVHHLWFSDADYARLGNQIKCNPAIKTTADRDAIRDAIRNDTIDTIATDHAPHTWTEKQSPSYFQAPSGLPLVQHSLPILLDLWKDGIFDLATIVRKTSHAVADLFHIRDRGYIREGFHADLVLVNPDATATVTRDNIHYQCHWSPLEGHTFRTRVEMTLVNGQIVYENGTFPPRPPSGQRLVFDS
ncbi:MAG: dihydroorotase [Puniceicoccales bacterium]|jgi:dihydroorotase|nr:dihydroorotase [Puniceicoccales bacterium]